MEKKHQKKLTNAIDPELNKILEDGGYNKSKFINSLLKKYIKKIKEKNSENS
jgi:metal-responsive CopG/Arc/MetJ family transcriptional regulator